LTALQLLGLFVWKLTYLEPKLFLSITFHNSTLLINKIVIIFKTNAYIYTFFAV
jgi:hypothetical protein